MSVALNTVVANDGLEQRFDGHPRVMYVINSFDRGGAEAGLISLVRDGLFANCRLQIVALARGRGGLEEQLRELGQEPRILLDRARMRPTDLPALARSLWRLIAQERPNVVIASLPQANLLVRMCLLLRRQTLAISFEHNTHLAKRIYEIGFRLSSFRVDWTFADSDSTLEQAGERLYMSSPRRGSVLPLVSFAQPAKRTYRPAGEPFHVVHAARFTATKNQAALIHAVGLLRKSGRKVKLTLYGDGPERNACEALAVRLDIADSVRFAGFVPDWPTHEADLFVLPSRHEGLCLVVLEAMHAGIPVAAPIIGGLCDYGTPDLLECLPDVEPDTLARTISNVSEQRAKLAARVARAADMIDRRFSSEIIRRTYAEINAALIATVAARSIHPGSTAGRGVIPLGR